MSSLFRLDEPRLAIPGVIGVAAEWDGVVSCVSVGPHAGLPSWQALNDWKSEVALASPTVVLPARWEALGIRTAAAELAELDDYVQTMADDGVDVEPGRRAQRAMLLATSRVHVSLTDDQRTQLTRLGAASWAAGYSRWSSLLSLHHSHDGVVDHAYVGFHDHRHDYSGCGTAWRDERAQIFAARWADRVFRALSHGEVSIAAVLYAMRRRGDYGDGRLIADEVARMGHEAAAEIAAGEERVRIPLHGIARRVELPAFMIHVDTTDPFDASATSAPRQVVVPADVVWAWPTAPR